MLFSSTARIDLKQQNPRHVAPSRGSSTVKNQKTLVYIVYSSSVVKMAILSHGNYSKCTCNRRHI